jgi:hypothetical protein
VLRGPGDGDGAALFLLGHFLGGGAHFLGYVLH